MNILKQKKKIDQQKNEIKNITDKFKELKSLVYDYKNFKEKEISNLSENQTDLENEIAAHRINYENLVDKATSEIESFIKKYETDTQVQ